MKSINNNPTNPIGIFDSGIGGLTVAHAIRELLPHENIIYFGDTAHLPYGDKSEAAIQAYSIKIANLLLEKGCKVIVIACHSASSAAYELLKEYVNHHAFVINVIDPMIDYVSENFAGASVGLIGTKRTIQSGVYVRKFAERDKKIKLKTLATPLLAPMIEEGFFNNQISHKIIEQYLSDPELNQLDALILGCTHYPLIKREIEEFYNDKVKVLDSSLVAAQSLRHLLSERGLLNHQANPESHFYVSDYTESFENSTRLFFGENVRLEKHNLWN
ncbi:MAG TPA: glutamate racemase [Cytophagales bacterium]|jgi:glutamate racemase|nr:glutamate racemase [Cytophagales bacterium]